MRFSVVDAGGGVIEKVAIEFDETDLFLGDGVPLVFGVGFEGWSVVVVPLLLLLLLLSSNAPRFNAIGSKVGSRAA